MNRLEELVELITNHKNIYYNGMPQYVTKSGEILKPISDAEFDSLEAELRTYDPNNTILSQVGTNVVNDSLNEVLQHTTRMLSIKKTKDKSN